MLKITTLIRNDRTTLELSGRLAGAWVDQFRNTWQQAAAGNDRIQVVLEEVTFIDAAGKGLLADMYRQGAQLVGSGCMTKAIIEQITQEELPHKP